MLITLRPLLRPFATLCHPERSPERMRGQVEGPCVPIPSVPIPIRSQVFPSRIKPPNQPQLLLPPPALQLLFAIDRLGDLIEALPIHKPRGVVVVSKSLRPVRLCSKTRRCRLLVIPNVEGPARTALQHVNVEVIFARHVSTICGRMRMMRCRGSL